MMTRGVNHIAVVILLTIFSVEVESSAGGFRGELSENIQKSPHKIVHTIEVKAAHQSEVILFCS